MPMPDLGVGMLGDHIPMTRTKDFEVAIANYPKCEIDAYVSNLRFIPAPLAYEMVAEYDRGEYTRIIKDAVYLRFANPLCSACSKYGHKALLRRCQACQLVCYCGSECQKADWDAHQLWCCKGDTAVRPAADPYEIRVAHVPSLVNSPTGNVRFIPANAK